MRLQFSRPIGRNATLPPLTLGASARHAQNRDAPAVARRTAGLGRSSKAVGVVMAHPQKHPGTAAVLSLIVPGIGQFYNGDFLRGIFWLIVTPGFWIGTGGLFGWVCHVIAAMTAHHRARVKNALPA
jgi:hypothetical protein